MCVLIRMLLIVGILFWGCEKSKVTTAKQNILDQADSADIPDREGWDATIRVSSDGKLKAVIQYGHVIYFEDDKINYFDHGVEVNMFDKKGKHTTKLTAKKGEYHELSQNIWAIGQVVVVSDTGITLYTPVGRWDQHLEKIISDTSVMVTTVENDTIYGSAFQSDADLSHMLIRNPHGIRKEGIDLESWEKEISKPVSKDSTESL